MDMVRKSIIHFVHYKKRSSTSKKFIETILSFLNTMRMKD